jgi:hypothetical protein
VHAPTGYRPNQRLYAHDGKHARDSGYAMQNVRVSDDRVVPTDMFRVDHESCWSEAEVRNKAAVSRARLGTGGVCSAVWSTEPTSRKRSCASVEGRAMSMTELHACFGESCQAVDLMSGSLKASLQRLIWAGWAA